MLLLHHGDKDKVSLHKVEREVKHPTHLTKQHLQGLARFLWEYSGRYPVTVSRVPDAMGYSVWYLDYTNNVQVPFTLFNLVAWATDTYYTDHEFRWDDVRIINNVNDLDKPFKIKEYVRHD